MNAKKKILIADDEKALSRALDLKLSSAGFETRIANDGQTALEMLKKENFDLVLLDLVMPKIDGFGVLEKLRENNINTSVIILSNLSQKEDAKKTKDLGAVDYFIKSDVPLSDIVEKIKNVLK